jgi:hypothetical protein
MGHPVCIRYQSTLAGIKGQLISEQIYAVLNFPKMQQILPGFLP